MVNCSVNNYVAYKRNPTKNSPIKLKIEIKTYFGHPQPRQLKQICIISQDLKTNRLKLENEVKKKKLNLESCRSERNKSE